jgi:TRAP-type C4-dicarboxylate transport system permease small subunit
MPVIQLYKKGKFHQMTQTMKKFLDYLLKAETIAAGVVYTLAAVILFADVMSRELFGNSIWGSQRIAVLFANAAAFIGIGVATAMDRHIRPVIMDNVFPESFDSVIERLGNLLAALVLFTGAYFAVELVLSNREMGFTANPLDLKIWIPQCILPYGLISAGVRYLIFCLFPGTHPTKRGLQDA